MLTAERKKEIKNLADGTRTQYLGKTSLPPYSPVALASNMGIEVVLAKFVNENISAAILFKEKGEEKNKPKIYIKANDNPLRQNFSVAHEIGHYVLHKKDFIDEPSSFWRDPAKKDSPEELEADLFAAELLMPEEKFKSRWKEAGGQAEELSKEFQVSVSAIFFRAKNLELIS